MRKFFIDSITSLINSTSDSEKKVLQTKFLSIISTLKFNNGDLEYEIIAKNRLIEDIKQFVETDNKSLLPFWLVEFPNLIDE